MVKENTDISQKPQQKSLLSGSLSLVSLVIFLVLIVSVVLRWNDLSWGQVLWLLSTVVMMVIRMPHTKANRHNIIRTDRNDTVEKLVLLGMLLSMMLLPLTYLATSVLNFANYTLPAWATVTGAFLQLPFLWLFWRSHADLGRNWSPGLEVRNDHALITEGVYRSIRHPMYAAIWLAAFAQPLLLHNWLAGFLVIPAFTAMWVFRIPKEEGMMVEQFGDSYKEYQAHTGQLFPKYSSR